MRHNPPLLVAKPHGVLASTGIAWTRKNQLLFEPGVDGNEGLGSAAKVRCHYKFEDCFGVIQQKYRQI